MEAINESLLTQGDLVEYDWGNKVVEGLFVKFDYRGPLKRCCAVIDIDGKGEMPVPLVKVRKVL